MIPMIYHDGRGLEHGFTICILHTHMEYIPFMELQGLKF